MVDQVVAFSAYRANPDYPVRPPDMTRQQSADEEDKITADDGLLAMPECPAICVEISDPGGGSKYLWVVTATDVPIAIEKAPGRRKPQRGYLSHTNLTGGGVAHAGGELWFVSDSELYINGASSRYQPRSNDELRAIASGFAHMGYRVASLGWDEQAYRPARLFRKGSLEWFP